MKVVRSALALFALGCLGFGCGGGSDNGMLEPDADLGLAACEAAVAMAWRNEPPVTGLAPAAARASYQAVIADLMTDYGVPGGSVAVTRNGKLVAALGIGFAEYPDAPDTGLQPAHPDQLFRLASVSKQITAVAILRLVEANQLSLDDKLTDLIDHVPLPGKTMNPQWDQITVRHLLLHTGGWNRGFEAVGDPMFRSAQISAALGVPGPADADMVVRYMMDKPLTYAPGTVMCYSNFGYALLGRVIEAVTHESYEAYTKRVVLDPVGATDAIIGGTRLSERADNEVRYYDHAGAPLVKSVFPDVSSLVPLPYGGWYNESLDAHGGWIASALDMLRFQVSIDGDSAPVDLLTAGSLASMLAHPHVPTCTNAGGTNVESSDYWYGFGFSVNRYDNYWHGGSLPGTATEDVIASDGHAWAALFNSRPADGTFDSRLDHDLWVAKDGADSFSGLAPGEDFFDQYPEFSSWVPATTFDSQLATHLAAGRYPSRLEGRAPASGEVELRARWARKPAGASVSVAFGLDCAAYAARESMEDKRRLASLQTFKDALGVRRYQVVWISL
jgi:CubicO group peptidase (beta-lactamase class C family)